MDEHCAGTLRYDGGGDSWRHCVLQSSAEAFGLLEPCCAVKLVASWVVVSVARGGLKIRFEINSGLHL